MMEEVRKENVTKEKMRTEKRRKKKAKVGFWLKIMPIMLVIAAAVAAGLAVGRLAGSDAGAGNGARASGLVCDAVMAAESNDSSSTTGQGTDRRINDGNGSTESDGGGDAENVDGEWRVKGGSEGNSYVSSDGVYDFKDNKTTGTVTVTKEWSDKRENE